MYYYHDGHQFRVAFIVSRKRINMSVLLVQGNKLRLRAMPLSEQRFMRPVDAGKRQRRKAVASLRRKARAKGTPRSVRLAVKAVTTELSRAPHAENDLHISGL